MFLAWEQESRFERLLRSRRIFVRHLWNPMLEYLEGLNQQVLWRYPFQLFSSTFLGHSSPRPESEVSNILAETPWSRMIFAALSLSTPNDKGIDIINNGRN